MTQAYTIYRFVLLQVTHAHLFLYFERKCPHKSLDNL